MRIGRLFPHRVEKSNFEMPFIYYSSMIVWVPVSFFLVHDFSQGHIGEIWVTYNEKNVMY